MPALLLGLLQCSLLAVTYAFNITSISGDASVTSKSVDLNGTLTDASAIVNTVAEVDQKTGASGSPGQPVQDTAVTAIDGRVTASGRLRSNATSARVLGRALETKRSTNDYSLVFAGTGLRADARDASIEGTAYLTFTLVSNWTYNIDDCLTFCDSVEQCVFANLYYEFNNDALDHGKSNLKCAVYGDVHTAYEKTNWGGQQLEAPPAGLSYIKHSSGWVKQPLPSPLVPQGYDIVFGPIEAANNAPGYMGFVLLDRYDVTACAKECTARGADPNGGSCKYFNIWRAVVDGNPTTYTCSMYYRYTDASTATNFGQGNLKVTDSRGYSRRNYITDGSFESLKEECTDYYCEAPFGDNYWSAISSPGRYDDSAVVYYPPYAHTGGVAGRLGSGGQWDELPGTLKPINPLSTSAGKTYLIEFFYNSAHSGPVVGAKAYADILWNGATVSTTRGYVRDWVRISVIVTAEGQDQLAFRGGSGSAWVFIDDVFVLEVN